MKITVLAISVLTLSFIGCQPKKMNPKDFTQVNAIRHLPAPATAVKDSVPAPTTAVPVPAAEPATAKPKTTPRDVAAPTEKSYHIIVASYPNEPPARSKAESLRAQGFEEALVVQKDNRYRVSIAHFADKQAAINERARLSKLLGQDDLWIGRY